MIVLYIAVLIYFGGIIIQKDMIRRRKKWGLNCLGCGLSLRSKVGVLWRLCMGM